MIEVYVQCELYALYLHSFILHTFYILESAFCTSITSNFMACVIPHSTTTKAPNLNLTKRGD